MTIEVRSTAFHANQAIPQRYTADGKNVSPPLTWANLPAKTKALALIVDDPDAPRAEPFVHWLAYNIPPHAGALPENLPKQPEVKSPHALLQGTNSFNHTGYDGPSPPPGHGAHHYHFKLYALDQPLEAKSGLDKQALLGAISGHILGEGEFVATYTRPRR